MPNILIVEDSAEFKHVYIQLFSMYNIHVTAVSTGNGLDTIIEAAKPDLILLDIYLGHEDGRDICKAIKLTHNAIPVIMVSISSGLKAKSVACGADDYIKKPFDIKHLLGKVNKWTQNNPN
ncbi:MAG: histidine kinase [Ferruginibacter sp.]|uniref:response regulator transcription factor n=1 Tax=Ferruginibacter sp. TaxID=1940288 RepID=UPI002657E6F1|nr:response regulator [Ferruginibacter sp.]MDB5279069.1 histidine kinase [Ferruginibacter sp.]